MNGLITDFICVFDGINFSVFVGYLMNGLIGLITGFIYVFDVNKCGWI